MSYNFRYLLLTGFTFICIRVRVRARAGIIIYPDPFSSFAGLPGLDLWPGL